MMSRLDHSSEAEILFWTQERRSLEQELSNHHLISDQLMMEEELCAFLHVTSRTLRTYRNKGYFRYIKLEGRVYYLKTLVLEDLLRMSRRDGKSQGKRVQ